MSRNNPSGIKHSCPDIDKLIKQVRSAIKALEHAQKDNGELTLDYVSDAQHDLSDIEDYMENVRSINDQLRNYGEEQESIARTAEDWEIRYNEANERVEMLERVNEGLKEEIRKLDNELAETIKSI